jgi:hypothetical protein
MKNGLIVLFSVVGFVALVWVVQLIYVNFTNTHQVIENTNEAVRVCGENNVAAVTISGFTCNTPTFLLKARYQIESF